MDIIILNSLLLLSSLMEYPKFTKKRRERINYKILIKNNFFIKLKDMDFNKEILDDFSKVCKEFRKNANNKEELENFMNKWKIIWEHIYINDNKS